MPVDDRTLAHRRRSVEHRLGIDGERPICARSTDRYATPLPGPLNSLGEPGEPLFATVAAREQIVDWMMLTKNSDWRSANGLADRAAVEAYLPPALFATPASDGEIVTDPDDGQVSVSGGELQPWLDDGGTIESYWLSKLRDDALAWAQGDPQPS